MIYKNYIKSVRHYILNRNRPIFIILHKNRKNRLHQIIQSLKVIKNCTYFYKTNFPNINGKKIGISMTLNQSKALLEEVDFIITYDKRAIINSNSKQFIFVGVSCFKFFTNWLWIFLKLYKTKFYKYADIFAFLKSINLLNLKKILNDKDQNIYVSNINNPTIFFLLDQKDFFNYVIHIPHAEIGNTVLPKGDLVNKYYCASMEEQKKLSSKYPGGKYVLYQLKFDKYKYSNNHTAMIVLPKNWYDIDWSSHSFEGYNFIYLKPHPAFNLVTKLEIYYFFIKKYGLKKIAFKSSYDLSSSIYSISSAAIFELLKKGKYINFLSLKPGIYDHYNVDDRATKNMKDCEDNWKKQIKIIFGETNG